MSPGDEATTDEAITDGAAEDASVDSGQPGTDLTDSQSPDCGPDPQPELLHGAPVSRSCGQAVLHPSRDDYPSLVDELRKQGYWTCIDVCGVDYLGYAPPRDLPPGTKAERFEVAVVLRNHVERSQLRIRVQVPESDPTVASLCSIHPGAENPEREVYDMFGITFDGHPDMSRILMPDEWIGHPLRKDYDVGRIPVQFKGVSSVR